MKYTVELSELALRELAALTGKTYSEVTRSNMNISHTVEDYIHTSFNKLPKDKQDLRCAAKKPKGYERD